MRDFEIRELPFPIDDLWSKDLFSIDPRVCCADRPLSLLGREVRPKQLALLKEWQEAEVELNKDMIVWCKDLCKRSLRAFDKLSFHEWTPKENAHDPVVGYLSDSMYLWWEERPNLTGALVFDEFLSENARKFTDSYWRFHNGRHDMMMKNFIDANSVIRKERRYVSVPELHSLSELDLLLSVRGF